MGVQSTLAKISLCRTSALGGRWYSCDDCGEITKLHNSCGDRHCPGCAGAKRADFNERASGLITPGVDHYQVIFTVPEIISTIALGNRSEIADLLFKSAWRALEKTITAEQGYDPAALLVLHTWNQKLEAHWHVHALVPGAGPAIDGEGIKQATAPPELPLEYYLVDAIDLRRAFRQAFLRGMKSLYRRGKLSLGGSVEYLRDENAWDDLIKRLEQQEWVSHIEPPPSEASQADHVISYLTRYLTGGPISDQRILSADDREVTFLAREGSRTGGDREQVPQTLSVDEFMRRWCLHIQPHQLTKTRCFGGWSNSRRATYRQRMRSALTAVDGAAGLVLGSSAEPDSIAVAAKLQSKPLCCDSCGSESLRLSHQQRKPRWSELLGLDSQCSPWWYAASQEKEEKRLWDQAMGDGFYDWYVAHVLRPSESARDGIERAVSRQTQLRLPGMESDQQQAGSFYVDSF